MQALAACSHMTHGVFEVGPLPKQGSVPYTFLLLKGPKTRTLVALPYMVTVGSQGQYQGKGGEMTS